jgi:hypothetical protein
MHFTFNRPLRIVTQASPPFLVIHTNAAFCRLSGIDSHIVVGKPISRLLVIQLTTTERTDGLETGNSNQADLILSTQLNNEDKNGIGLERLVATSGFAHYHIVQVKVKPHHMVGRKITVVNEDHSANHNQKPTTKRDDSNSVTSSFDGQSTLVPCRSSIAPIVSATTSIEYTSVLKTDKDVKRMKHHHPQSGIEQSDRKKSANSSESLAYRKYQPLQLVTHYVIQLQPIDETSDKIGDMESLSSNSESIKAQLLGLSKDNVQRQREAAGLVRPEQPNGEVLAAAPQNHHEEMSTAESSSATIRPVTAIG